MPERRPRPAGSGRGRCGQYRGPTWWQIPWRPACSPVILRHGVVGGGGRRCQLRLGRFDRGLARGDLLVDALDRGPAGGDLRFGLRQRNAKVGVVENDERIARLDARVVRRRHRLDIAGDLGGHRRGVGRHVGVIGGNDEAPIGPPLVAEIAAGPDDADGGPRRAEAGAPRRRAWPPVAGCVDDLRLIPDRRRFDRLRARFRGRRVACRAIAGSISSGRESCPAPPSNSMSLPSSNPVWSRKSASIKGLSREEACQMTEPFSSIAVDITRVSSYFKIELNGSVIIS